MLTKKNKKSDDEENVFWVTMSDLLLGLTMVFMTLFVLAMTGFTQTKLQTQQIQSEVAKKLDEQLQEQKVEATVDDLTGQVKISDLELFEVNSYKLTDNGKKYLNKFIPIYVNTIFSKPELSNKIQNIVIEGHTDSQTFRNVNSKEEQFTKNMDLSLKRANAVEDYIFKTAYNKKYTDKLVQAVLVEGKSYSDPIIINGKEDFDKSRRVELHLVVKNEDFQDFFKKK